MSCTYVLLITHDSMWIVEDTSLQDMTTQTSCEILVE